MRHDTYGRYSDTLISTALEHGLTTVLWSVTPGRSTAEREARRVVRLARAGSIIRLSANETDPDAASIARLVLAGLAEKHLAPETLSRVLARDRD